MDTVLPTNFKFDDKKKKFNKIWYEYHCISMYFDNILKLKFFFFNKHVGSKLAITL